jgi:hypothetical protein
MDLPQREWEGAYSFADAECLTEYKGLYTLRLFLF